MTSAGWTSEHCGPLPGSYRVHSLEKSPAERRSGRGRSRPPSLHTNGIKDHRGSFSDDFSTVMRAIQSDITLPE